MIIKTDYDAFKTIKEGLLKQNCRSLDGEENCRYRGWSEQTIEKAKSLIDYPDPDDFYSAFLDELHNIPYDSKCAVGYIISDNFYDDAIENTTVEDEVVVQAIFDSNPEWSRSEKTLQMLVALQQIHDLKSLAAWPEEFELFEDRFNEKGEYDW